jgi:hypothetical protein
MNAAKGDIINLVRALANQVKYFDLSNSSDGNWTSFFNFPDTGSTIVVNVATSAELPRVTYDNGSAGVGATLTALANGALPQQDGLTVINGDLLLVWQQADASQNGVYTVTQGTGSAPFKLTRTSGADTTLALNTQTVEVTGGVPTGAKVFLPANCATCNRHFGYKLPKRRVIAF